jgi:redox-sensitive bicupin YhaK (pirin superfamily)
MGDSAVFDVVELGFPWRTFDPFLFCVHHLDFYPAGNEEMGPATSLAGRDIGMDFAGKDGWRMYHGDVVPGFPRHPHRGFETVTLARQGFIDHSDSLGATARFGNGDVQWMTAGSGIVHAEMFPLVRREAENPTELFQIWLNLPSADKMVDPHFSMLWAPTIPRLVLDGGVQVTMVAGALGDAKAPAPPPSSWASRSDADVAIWTIRMPAGSGWTIPACGPDTGRTLYFFSGSTIDVDGTELSRPLGVRLKPGVELTLANGDADAELLLLQGKPIAEPVAHYGPFVMNTPQQLQQAMIDYRRTQFGGWPWKADGPVHAREQGRFAIHADGRREDGPS